MKKSTQEIVQRTCGRDTGGSSSSKGYYPDSKLDHESVTHTDGSNVSKSYYDNANNVLAEVRTNNAEGSGTDVAYDSYMEAANDKGWRLAA